MKKIGLLSVSVVALLSQASIAATEFPPQADRGKEKPNGLVFDESVLAPLSKENGVIFAPEAPARPSIVITPIHHERSASSADSKKQTEINDPLTRALAHVYSSNPQLLAEREKLKIADEGVSQAVSGFRPNVSAGYDRGRERTASGSNDWRYNDNFSKSITVTQPIFSGGDSVANFKSAKNRVNAARADLAAVEQQVLYDAVVAYTLVVEKESLLNLNQHNVEVLTQQRDAASARFDVGELTRTDVAQAEARLARAQADSRQALGDLEVAKANFQRVIGYPAPAGLAMPALPTGLPQTIDEAATAASAANPILTAARQREKAFRNDIDARVADILPDVSIQGSMGNSKSNRSVLGRGSLDSEALTLNVTIPLYQSGAEWSRLRESRNIAQQAHFTAIDTSLAVAEDVTRAWQDFNTAQSIISSNDAAVKAAALALEGVRQENEFGARTVLDVLDAEQELLNSQVLLVSATRNEKVQAYRLLATIGKLTAQDLSLPVETYDPKEHYDNVKYQLLGW